MIHRYYCNTGEAGQSHRHRRPSAVPPRRAASNKRGTPDCDEGGPSGSDEAHVARHALSPGLRQQKMEDKEAVLDYSQYADESLEAQTMTGQPLLNVSKKPRV